VGSALTAVTSPTLVSVSFVHFEEISVDFSAASRTTFDILSPMAAEDLNASLNAVMSIGNEDIISVIILL
jgi:hypothetical protein